jgi:hypothetical protein
MIAKWYAKLHFHDNGYVNLTLKPRRIGQLKKGILKSWISWKMDSIYQREANRFSSNCRKFITLKYDLAGSYLMIRISSS